MMKLTKHIFVALFIALFCTMTAPQNGFATVKPISAYLTNRDVPQTICVDENGNGIIDDNEPCNDEGHVPDTTNGE